MFAIIFHSLIVVFHIYVLVPPKVNIPDHILLNHPVHDKTEFIIGDVIDQLTVIIVPVLLSVIIPPLNV
ncbi:MAG: hypothetical protein WCL02_09955 [bacterium]